LPRSSGETTVSTEA